MEKLLPHEIKAIEFINMSSKKKETFDKEQIQKLLKQNLLEDIQIEKLINNIFQYSFVTINFHPDRISNRGTLIIEEILKEGMYYSQFKTGTTSGSKTAYTGGERDLWERELFGGHYHCKETNHDRRVKYGSLNIMNYKDGASPRFGSCYFKLNRNILDRCTFTFGDSYLKPKSTGTKDSFYSIMRTMLDEIIQRKRFFNSNGYNLIKAIKYLSEMNENNLSTQYGSIGKALDDYIEVQIHGDINLKNDIECFVLDESFKGTEILQYILKISKEFDINVEWISARKVFVNDIPDEFRGPIIKPFAKKILEELQTSFNYIDANTIGRASRLIERNPSKWSEFGDTNKTFQYLKQLWHVLVQYG
ncbi:DUF3626 domain-containing protein [Clostridium sediminicola]|uniref:DUF3626 domain-containing protein n=1 Tax=Clostridium sediminicola TaxID=3114879 RepID=UPI0031F245F9